jgi:hypothetical protein
MTTTNNSASQKKLDFYTPVALLLYARVDATNEILSILKKINLRKLYVLIDFPNNTTDDGLIEKNEKVRKIIECIDWECEIKVIHNESNLGPFKSYNKLMDFVFLHEDRIIYLEDDNIPNQSFFYYCQYLLEKYKLDNRIRYISGMNRLDNYPSNYRYDYFFSKTNTHWGHATWKRTYDFTKTINDYIFDEYYRNLIRYKSKYLIPRRNLVKISESFYRFGRYKGYSETASYKLNSLTSHLLTNSLVIVPSKNLVMDVGATNFTVHGDELKYLPKRIQKMYNRSTFEIEFPLKDPPYVVDDIIYSKKIYVLRNTLSDKFNRSFRLFFLRGPSAFFKKVVRYIYMQLNIDYLNKERKH